MPPPTQLALFTQILIVAGIILGAGVLGGFANLYIAKEGERISAARSIVLGITAAATIPLFLHFATSNLLEQAGTSGKELLYFVFAGLCVLAAMFSSRFLESLSARLLQDVQDLQKKVQENTEIVDTMADKQTAISAADVADEPPVTTTPELGADLPGFSSRSAGALNGTPPEPRQAMLEALNKSNFVFLSLQSLLGKVPGLAEDQVLAALTELEREGKVKSFVRNGTRVWATTR